MSAVIRKSLVAAAFIVVAVVGACARAIVEGGTDDASTDGTLGEGSTCQFDTTNDPQHCGLCSHACSSGEVCSSSACKSQCDSPTTKCTGDAGVLCVNLTSDALHCGQCTNACKLADAGALPLGTSNPDAGVSFDGGYDGGPGWSLGTAECEASTCNIACPGGMTKCADSICYDPQNHHDHCGACTTACAADEWCDKGNCCAQGTEWCGSSCVAVLTDPSNCGSCGNVCSGGTPYCSAGKCSKGCVPSGTRQAFNTLSSSTVTGCWKGNPCGTDTYTFSSTNGVNYQNVGENFVCSGTTACVGHVGVTTYGTSTVCQGAFDILCDGVTVGNINTVGKTCIGTAMTNTCNTSFTPVSCSKVTVQLSAGAGTDLCCNISGTGPDTMVVGVSAW